MTADLAVQERPVARVATGVIDCDIHPNLKTLSALDPCTCRGNGAPTRPLMAT